MKCLVSGGVGFLGSHLIEALTKRGDEVWSLDNYSRYKFSSYVEEELVEKKAIKEDNLINEDITLCAEDFFDFDGLQELIEGKDVIYHMAALPSHRLALERPRDYIEIDCMGTANILEAARLCKKPPLVVFASTNKVYGKQECPWREDKLPQPEGPYAVSKWSAEKLCEMYTKYFKVPTVILRYHHVAGARSNPELALSIFTEQASRNEIMEIHGTFDSRANFTSCSANYTHVDDAVRATLLAADKYDGFNIFNIANKRLIDVQYIAEYVYKKFKNNRPLKQVPLLPHETLRHQSDVSKIEKKLGFVAEIPIEKAFDDYIRWFQKYENSK